MEGINRRIKFAYYLDLWEYEDGDKVYLKNNSTMITPSEFTLNMDGNIFCPVCFTNLTRVPKDKDHFSNGRDAHFSHLSKYSDIKCDLRSKRPEGKRYDTFEEAQKAIDDENLVIASGFIKDKPVTPTGTVGDYDETPVEDVNGEITDVPISRHNGESFKLPSKITTVNGICRNFDKNLLKYYFFPGQKHAIRLNDLLHSVKSISEEDNEPKLYYGVIQKTKHLGEHQRPDNIRMTYFENNQYGVQDFCLKQKDLDQKSHGITDSSIGRTVLVYGVVSENGTGLCFKNLGWGEFALLPIKYAKLLL